MEQPQKPTSFTFTLSDNWTQYVMDVIAERPAKECLPVLDFFRSEIVRQTQAAQQAVGERLVQRVVRVGGGEEPVAADAGQLLAGLLGHLLNVGGVQGAVERPPESASTNPDVSSDTSRSGIRGYRTGSCHVERVRFRRCPDRSSARVPPRHR